MKYIAILFSFTLWLADNSIAAQIEPAALSYQGTLTNSTGQPLDGTKSIQICLYKSPTGASGLPAPDPANGSAFWCDNYTVALKNGQFSVVLGRDGNELKGKLSNFDGKTYVGVRAGTDPEMTPRQKLTSVAYAFNGVPRGGIIMWSGAIDQIPSGWALCDGSNETPNLTDRFIVGAGNSYTVKATGGELQHTLTILEIPIHNHSAKTQINSKSLDHSHNTQSYLIPPGMPHQNFSGGSTSFQWSSGTGGVNGGEAAMQHDHPINNDGSGQPHENRPPYYALAYIMKL